jgi:hypothetical protein
VIEETGFFDPVQHMRSSGVTLRNARVIEIKLFEVRHSDFLRHPACEYSPVR